MTEVSFNDKDVFIRHSLKKLCLSPGSQGYETERSFLVTGQDPYSMYLLRLVNEIGDIESFLGDLKPVKVGERSIGDYAVFGITYKSLKKLMPNVEVKLEKDPDNESIFRKAHCGLYILPSLTKQEWGIARRMLLAAFEEIWPNNKMSIDSEG